MSQTIALSRQVDGGVRARAVGYLRSGAVHIVSADAGAIEATVSGSDLYQVDLALEGQSLRVKCTCPYFQDRLETCKHIWATLMTADAQGRLQAWGNLKKVRLIEEAEDLEDEDWSDGQEVDWDRPPRPAFQRPSRPAKPKKPNPPDWKKALKELHPTNQPGSYYQRSKDLAGCQIVYIIDREATLEGQGLTLETAFQERKKDGDWSKPKVRAIEANQVESLPDTIDRQIVSFLLGAQQSNAYYSGYYSNGRTARYRLAGPQQEFLLPLMCRTGRCFMRKDRLDAALLPMQWDEGAPWEFRLNVAEDGKNYQLRGALVRGERSEERRVGKECRL